MPARTLSEPEFDAIKASILDAAPKGLKEDEFNRYVGPAMAAAIGTAEHSTEPVTGSAIGRFAAGAWSALNPMNVVNAIAHPVDTLDAITNRITAEKDQARTLASQGRYVEAAAHAGASALPGVGPGAVDAGEAIARGDVAGGLGQGTGLVGTVVAPRAIVATGRAVAELPRPSGPQIVKGVITAGKLIKSPIRTTIGIVADELARRNAPPEPPGHVSAPGYPRTGTTPAPEAVPPAAAPTEFEAARAARAASAAEPTVLKPGRPGGNPDLPDVKAASEARLAEIRAAYQAKQASAPAAAAAEPVVAASGKMQLTAPEMQQFTRLITNGVKLPDALAEVKAMRELAGQFDLPTPTRAQTQFPKGTRR
jgi:hypothetical protein